MGVKFAAAMGADVVLFTTSPGKTEDAKRLGAKEVVISKNEDEMKKHAGSFDFILDTVAAKHDIDAYLGLLKLDGSLVLVGVPEKPLEFGVFSLIFPGVTFPARSSAASPRRRRCSISAPNTELSAISK